MKNYKTTGRTIIEGKPFAVDTALRLTEEGAKGYVKAGLLIEVDEDGEPLEQDAQKAPAKRGTPRKTTSKG
ncbi:hypothetical protein PsAD2_03024 [Pseudovibrio axinellae]|uniref:Uncharacterized protein n=1 Tax=Pseudovibrio axinellae TaxID=989403 RepID=A0A165XGN5_9HYPH|nr:hypothetical protein [Pseudovibrio axinellae]KZL17687.1 hypothetical protein PsAD2_03024 [Pseudovibrio axinellae]SER43604.1 hypothetical protein SAMN05421798_11057 [Pseudovibrio axinellae]